MAQCACVPQALVAGPNEAIVKTGMCINCCSRDSAPCPSPRPHPPPSAAPPSVHLRQRTSSSVCRGQPLAERPSRGLWGIPRETLSWPPHCACVRRRHEHHGWSVHMLLVVLPAGANSPRAAVFGRANPERICSHGTAHTLTPDATIGAGPPHAAQRHDNRCQVKQGGDCRGAWPLTLHSHRCQQGFLRRGGGGSTCCRA